MIVNKKQRLIFIVVYPLVAYVAFHYLGPIVVAIGNFSKATFSVFPLILIHGLILSILGLGIFFFFIVGFGIWIMEVWEVVFGK